MNFSNQSDKSGEKTAFEFDYSMRKMSPAYGSAAKMAMNFNMTDRIWLHTVAKARMVCLKLKQFNAVVSLTSKRKRPFYMWSGLDS